MLTKKQLARVESMIEAGVIYRVIGKEFHISISHISNIRQRAGLPRRIGENTQTRERLDKFVALWEQGLTYKQLGEELGISLATVQHWRDKTSVLRRHAPRRGPRINQVRLQMDISPAIKLRLKAEAKAQKVSLGEWLRRRLLVPYGVVIDNVD